MTNKKSNHIKSIAATVAAFALLIGVCVAAVGFLGSGFRHGSANQPDSGDVNQTPPIQTAPTDNQYIGKDAAKQIAFDNAIANHPGYTGNITYMDARAELDHDDGKAIYEVELWIDNTEYEYDIDAVTGDILHVDTEMEDKKPVSPDLDMTDPPDGRISPEMATEFALAHAGATADAVKDLEVDLEDGSYYEISFEWNGSEYEYKIDADSGEILKSNTEADDDFEQDVPPVSSDGIEAAEHYIQIALTHAGVNRDQISDLDYEFDKEYDLMYFELEFDYNGLEYEYCINTLTEEIVYSRNEPSDDTITPPTGLLSKEDALHNALKYAALQETVIYDVEIDFDNDYPSAVYEISFHYNHPTTEEIFEYEFVISAQDGSIILAEKEIIG